MATAIGGFLGWFLGGMDGFLYALIVFVAVDYITGVMGAIQDRKLTSNVGSRGIFRKVMIFLLVGIAHMVDSQLIGHDSVIRTAVIFFYLSNEGISILENAAHLGLPVPDRLKSVLRGLYSEKEEAKDKALEHDEHSNSALLVDAETAETVVAAVVDNVVDTVKETVRYAMRETLMEASSELGVWPELPKAALNVVPDDELPSIMDADPNADLSGDGEENTNEKGVLTDEFANKNNDK